MSQSGNNHLLILQMIKLRLKSIGSFQVRPLEKGGEL